MAVISGSIQLTTRGEGDIIDLTGAVSRIVRETPLENGIITIFCPSATSALTTIEYEAGCITDLQRLFDELVPPDRDYAHNARWGDGNGHSHVRAALLKPSLTIPIIERQLTLGTWQQIIYVDFDNRPRQRSLVTQMIGE
jgi:secondary thiamine-phosphate synthase enzyme